MPKDGKHRFTPTEDMLAKNISKEYQKKGYPKKEADSLGYATVSKLNHDKKFRSSVMHKLRDR